MRRAFILIAVSTLIASCDVGRIQPDGRPVGEVWGGSSMELRVSDAPSPLAAEREVPLMTAPEVFAVYVPSHVDRSRDVMVGEHWVYFRLRDGEWFIERDRAPDPPVSGDATEKDLRLLRDLEGLEHSVVPWKERK